MCIFEVWILESLGEGFGRVWGGQNPRFSHFFRVVFHCEIWKAFGKANKNGKRPSVGGPLSILGRPGGMCRVRGEDMEGGSRISGPGILGFDSKLEMLSQELGKTLVENLARFAPPSVGRRI